MKFYVPVLVIFSMLLASCDAQPVPDWCYTFYFADYAGLSDKINVEAGTWNAGTGGILADEAGYIILNFQEEFFVHQAYTEVTFTRFASDLGDASISVNADVFGHHIEFNQTLPDDPLSDSKSINRPSEQADDTDTVNITLYIDKEFRLDNLHLGGHGVSPFPDNPCGPPTPTAPPTTTPIASSTNTPTSTSTSTRTPTPTGTLATCWRMDYDFLTSSQGMGATHGTWASGIGWEDEEFHPNSLGWDHSLFMYEIAQPLTVFRVDVTQTHTLGLSPSNFKIDFANPGVGTPTYAIYDQPITTGIISWQGTATATKRLGISFVAGEDIGGVGDPAIDPGGSITVSHMSLWGTGAVGPDWDGDVSYLPCHDLTPTPTLTPTATIFTNTPTPTRTWTPFPVTNPPTAVATRTPLVVASPTRTNTPIATLTPTRTLTPEPTLTFPPPTVTNTPGPTIPASPTYTTATGFPLVTFLPPGYTPTYGGTGIPGLGGTTIWGTPDGTFTPMPSLELIPTLDNGTQYHSDIYNGLGTAAANINSLPSNINGQLPAIDGNFGVFSGYARWAMSSVSLQEVLGQKFYPIGQHIFIWVGIVLFWNGAQLAIRIAVLLIKVFVWIFHQILKFIPFFG